MWKSFIPPAGSKHMQEGVPAPRTVTPLSYATLIVPIAGLIIALASRDLRLLIYTHVITGGTWTGIDLFYGLVLSRVMKGLTPDSRAEFVKRIVPIAVFFVPVLAGVAITSGITLALRYNILDFKYPMIVIAVVVVTVLVIQGFGIILPSEIRIYRELRKEVPDKDKIVRLGLRIFRMTGSQAIFQLALIYVMANLRLGILNPF
jgi:hypothetical protein